MLIKFCSSCVGKVAYVAKTVQRATILGRPLEAIDQDYFLFFGARWYFVSFNRQTKLSVETNFQAIVTAYPHSNSHHDILSSCF